ncbi:MAG: ABC transporter permease [Bacteroidetes bacterium]|nr:ABC transporter permease [Bacteroidota bacterium]MDA0904233.1 ABC transporter permease [Bacteroidota bacterium]MDA1242983.1 ABC transporter permease [Bacteroidota bacterium]
MAQLLRRLVQSAGVLWGSLTLVFLIFSQVPDPARAIAGQNERAEAVAAFRATHGLDLPVVERYIQFMAGLLPWGPTDSGDWGWKIPSLGKSYLGERPVVEALAEALPATMLLAVTAMGLALCVGIVVGLWLAWIGEGRVARWVIGGAALGMSAPSFFVALLVAWLLGHVWHEYTGLPVTGGWRVIHPFQGPQVAWKHLILPALTLGVRPLSVVIQLTRNAAADVLNESYIRTARAKGVSGPRLMFKHVLRNAMNPVITAASGWFAGMLAGAVFVEFVFGWNGMGLLMFRALEQGDLPMVMGGVLVIATTFVLVNVVVDAMYGWLDPRVRLT